MIKSICHRLTALIPQKYNEFSNQEPIKEVIIKNGTVTIESDINIKDETITIVGSPLNYTEHTLATEWVNYAHKVINNIYETPFKWYDLRLTGGILHHNIRIAIFGNEEIAFNHFASDTKSMIAIIYDGAKGMIGDKDNLQSNSDILFTIEQVSIIVFLYDKNDTNQQTNLDKMIDLQSEIMQIFHYFKPDTAHSTMNFEGSINVLNTDNTTATKLVFTFNKEHVNDSETWAYGLDFDKIPQFRDLNSEKNPTL